MNPAGAVIADRLGHGAILNLRFRSQGRTNGRAPSIDEGDFRLGNARVRRRIP